MAPEKRKRPQESSAPKSKPAPKAAAEGPNKRLKPSTTPGSGDRAPIPTPSTLRDDEASSFPRGGASALTPLEYKEVANEAMKDALFEAGGAAVSSTTLLDAGSAQKKKKQQQRHSDQKKKGKKGDGKKEKEKDTGPKVEGLSYKVRPVCWSFPLLWRVKADCGVLVR